MGAVPPSENSLDAVLNTIDTRVKNELNGDSDKANNITTGETSLFYLNYFQYTTLYSSLAHFNSRTGRFTMQENAMRLNPKNFTIENRATKQMSYYFDVDNYTEEYNRRRLGDSVKKRRLTRKEIDCFKKIKKGKKKRAREWLLQ
ncbi:hypothetical protein K501DRAFT_174359 [Backusella circina FSU 941]|nr:hypothetical protein K501DRAFT_174359 [Backusella circina FSU 941]